MASSLSTGVGRRTWLRGVAAATLLVASVSLVQFANQAPASAAGNWDATKCKLGGNGLPIQDGGTVGPKTAGAVHGAVHDITYSITFPGNIQCDWTDSTDFSGASSTGGGTTTTYANTNKPANAPDPNAKPPAPAIPDGWASTDIIPAPDDKCKLVAAAPGDPEATNGQVPNTAGSTYVGYSGVTGFNGGSTINATGKLVQYDDRICGYAMATDGTTGHVTNWALRSVYKPTSNQQPSVPTSTTKNVKDLANGLEFYALILCVGIIFIGAALWAIGSKGQNPGQELTGKRAFIVALTAAFLIGTIPALMTFLNAQEKSADTVGVVPGSDAANNGIGAHCSAADTANGTPGC